MSSMGEKENWALMDNKLKLLLRVKFYSTAIVCSVTDIRAFLQSSFFLYTTTARQLSQIDALQGSFGKALLRGEKKICFSLDRDHKRRV